MEIEGADFHGKAQAGFWNLSAAQGAAPFAINGLGMAAFSAGVVVCFQKKSEMASDSASALPIFTNMVSESESNSSWLAGLSPRIMGFCMAW